MGAARQVERERGMRGCRPERPLEPSAVLFLRGPFWALFREVAGVLAGTGVTRRPGCYDDIPRHAIAAPPAGPPLPRALWCARARGAEHLAWVYMGGGRSGSGMAA